MAAFARAMELVKEIHAANRDLPFKVTCDRALRQEYLDDQDRQRAPHKAA